MAAPPMPAAPPLREESRPAVGTGGVLSHPRVNAALVEEVAAWQPAKHLALLEVAQANGALRDLRIILLLPIIVVIFSVLSLLLLQGSPPSAGQSIRNTIQIRNRDRI